MYNFYFESKNEAHILPLTQNGGIIHLLCVNTSTCELLTWKKNIYLSTIRSFSDDKQVIMNSISIDENEVSLELVDGRNRNARIELNTDKYKLNHLEGGLLSLTRFLQIGTVSSIAVLVKYGEYWGKIIFHCVPVQHIYEVVLDFGSEASQMLIKRRDATTAVSVHKLFKSTLKHFYDVLEVKGQRVYDQQDEDEYLFRSIFYKKKNAECSEHFIYDKPRIDDSYFSFLSKRTESHEGRIPNIKIAYLTGININGIDMQLLHKGIVVRFFHEALQTISDILKKTKNNKQRIAVSFKILLPNVMPQQAVSSFMECIRDIVNSKDFNNVSGIDTEFVEVSSFSESDASFLDWVFDSQTGMPIAPNTRYLIVDVGKGTTDFSIVKVSDVHSVVSEYRSGFIGAGNAISYALFKDYMHAIGGDSSLELSRKMLSAEPAILFELENLIETYKRNWNKGKNKNNILAQSSRNFKESDPAVILEQIEDMGLIDDKYGEVSKIIDEIAENIVSNIPLRDIKNVVFSGRSFMFSELYQKLEKVLKDKIDPKLRVFYNKSKAKNGCLFGPLRDIDLSLHTEMIGFPTLVNGLRNINGNNVTNSESENSTGQEKHNTIVDGPDARGVFGTIERIVNSISDSPIFRNIVGLFDDGSNSVVPQFQDFNSEVRRLMIEGKSFNNIDDNSLIFISGNMYITSDGYRVRKEDRPYKIYFDGKQFYLKHRTGCHPLIMDTRRAERDLLKESQFPYSDYILND